MQCLSCAAAFAGTFLHGLFEQPAILLQSLAVGLAPQQQLLLLWLLQQQQQHGRMGTGSAQAELQDEHRQAARMGMHPVQHCR
jgi:hypothetical protein